MTKGIVYVAFGTEYDYQCFCSVKIIRQYTDLPILVISNLPQVNEHWRSISNVQFQHVESKNVNQDRNNRRTKISLHKYSPFDITMYCDTDTAVQSDVFLSGFEQAKQHDVMFSIYSTQTEVMLGGPYQETFTKLELQFPITIYKEGIFFFRKTPSTIRLFDKWLECWEKVKLFRDMPALMAACQLETNVDIGILPYGWDSPDGHVIVHAHGPYRTPGIPSIRKFKPHQFGW